MKDLEDMMRKFEQNKDKWFEQMTKSLKGQESDMNEAIIETIVGVQAQVTVLQQILVEAGITTEAEVIERSKDVLNQLLGSEV